MSIIYEDRMFKETKNETTYDADAFSDNVSKRL